jgi:hypothetical protein
MQAEGVFTTVSTPTYMCLGIIAKRNFRVETAVSIILTDGSNGSDVVWGNPASLYCD